MLRLGEPPHWFHYRILAIVTGTVAVACMGRIGWRRSPAEGLKFARDNCAECHHVGPKEPLVVFSPASPFSKIAADPKTTELSLRFFLRSSHIDMPNFILTEEQTDDLVAYILSLK